MNAFSAGLLGLKFIKNSWKQSPAAIAHPAKNRGYSGTCSPASWFVQGHQQAGSYNEISYGLGPNTSHATHPTAHAAGPSCHRLTQYHGRVVVCLRGTFAPA